MNLDKYKGYTAEQIAKELEDHIDMFNNPDPTNDGCVSSAIHRALVEQSIKELVIVGTLMSLRRSLIN